MDTGNRNFISSAPKPRGRTEKDLYWSPCYLFHSFSVMIVPLWHNYDTESKLI